MPDVFAGSPVQPIGQWRMQRVNGASGATPLPIGKNAVNTTVAASVAAGVRTLTPASMLNIVAGKWLSIVNGAAVETFQVLATTATTFQAAFVGSYGTNSFIFSVDGVWLGGIMVNQPGTTVSITLFNGLTSMLPRAGGIQAVQQPTSVGLIDWKGANFDSGGFYTLSGGAIGDYTFLYLDQPGRVV